jgi:hypothetical protein
MVRVVEQAATKQCVCQTCQAKLEYGYHDITEGFSRDYGGGGDSWYRITCPSCGKQTYVSRWK